MLRSGNTLVPASIIPVVARVVVTEDDVLLREGLATLLTPESGPALRRRISERLRRADQEIPEISRVVREPQPDPEPAA